MKCVLASWGSDGLLKKRDSVRDWSVALVMGDSVNKQVIPWKGGCRRRQQLPVLRGGQLAERVGFSL